MQKKIIAVCCLIVAVAFVLASCGNKAIIKADNGNEYVAVTDEEGNTVVNEDGDVVVYVTDAEGKYVKDANGEKQTNAINFPKKIVSDEKIETADYVLSIPDGWVADASGELHREDNESIKLHISKEKDLEEYETLDDYFAQRMEESESVFDSFKEIYPDSQMEMLTTGITQQNLDSRYVEYKAKGENGAIVYYSITLYVVHNNSVFVVGYVCDGTYDETVNAFDILNQNLTFKNL